MGVGVIPAGAVVAVLINRLVRRQVLQPVVVILVQAGLGGGTVTTRTVFIYLLLPQMKWVCFK